MERELESCRSKDSMGGSQIARMEGRMGGSIALMTVQSRTAVKYGGNTSSVHTGWSVDMSNA